MKYPRREKFFSHKFVRILHKSCAAQDIGSTACYLLCIIAHTEDAARYSGPVRFWNGQLIETMGFKSPKQLTAAREAAVESGWLQYDRDSNRSVGKYFVTIPPQFAELDDSPINPVNHSENGIIPESEILPGTIPNSERIRDERRNEFFLQSGKPSNPIPNPNPITVETTAEKIFESIRSVDGIPTPRQLTKERTKKIRARLKSPDWNQNFELALARLPLRGDGWQPDIDWLIANDSNVVKVIEGKYDWRSGDTKPDRTTDLPNLREVRA